MRISDWSSDVCSSDLSAAEGPVAGAAVEVRDPVLIREAVTAVDLERLVGHPDRHLVHMHLGDGGKVGVGKGVGAGAGPVEDRAPDLDVAIHLGEHPAHSLHRADRAAKGLAVAGIAQSLAERTLRSEEHTSELQSLMRISYAVFCL